ncbi:hypothetical protein Tco_1578457 [Tanacetum coccineum]
MDMFILHLSDIVNENYATGCKWKIKWNGADEFQVYYGRTQHCVHIGDKTCSYGGWQLSGIPCCHATASIRSRSKNPFDYLDKCYSKEKFISAYNHPIKVVGSEEFWLNSGRGELSPPLLKPMPGRPKKARRMRKYEPKKSKTKLSRHRRDMHCGNCNSNTHNSKMFSLYDGASTSHDASAPRTRTGCKRKKLSHPAKAEARGGTSWISLQHNGVYYRDTKRKRKQSQRTLCVITIPNTR